MKTAPPRRRNAAERLARVERLLAVCAAALQSIDRLPLSMPAQCRRGRGFWCDPADLAKRWRCLRRELPLGPLSRSTTSSQRYRGRDVHLFEIALAAGPGHNAALVAVVRQAMALRSVTQAR